MPPTSSKELFHDEATQGEHYAALGIVAFLAQATFSLQLLIRGAHYPHFVHWPHDAILDTLLTTAWLAATIALCIRLPGPYYGCSRVSWRAWPTLYFSLSVHRIGLAFLLAAFFELAVVKANLWAFRRNTPLLGGHTMS